MRLHEKFGLRSSLRPRFSPPSDQAPYARRCLETATRSRVAAFAMWAAMLLALAPLALAQSNSDASGEEVVANLAAGRVVIAVVKNAMLVATLENPVEAHTLPPTPVLLSSERFGVFLGPADWWSPPSQREIAELNQELPRLHTYAVATPPHLGQSKGGDQPAGIEIIGQSLRQRLNKLAQLLHGPLNWPSNEPFAQLIVADYFPNYGPEIWQLSYTIHQEEQSDNFWTSRIERPAYLQFYPPEKGQPRTLVEFDYPAHNAQASVLDLLRQRDPRVERVIESDPAMIAVAQHFLEGSAHKVHSADATQFLRAILSAIAPPHARETVGILHPDTGFRWILAPPPEKPIHRENRPPGAPTLQGKHTEPHR